MKALRDLLLDALPPERVREKEPMREHTTMRVGGPADLFASAKDPEEVRFVLSSCRAAGVPALLVGNGSNLIVRDGGIRGVVLHLGAEMSQISLLPDGALRAQAGAQMSRLAAAALNAGLTGLEFASGIPGSVGGGVAMNAGAYGGEIIDVLERAEVLMGEERVILSPEELEASYRTTRLLREGGILLSADFRLAPGDPAQIRERMEELNRRRREKQPLNHPSAGSTFKRPAGHYAGALIERSGLKGLRVGGVCVSEKHAGFLVNDRGGTAADVLALIRTIQERVFEDSGVRLEPEVRIVGEEVDEGRVVF